MHDQLRPWLLGEAHEEVRLSAKQSCRVVAQLPSGSTAVHFPTSEIFCM
jgi:hypothetical protein